MKKKFLVFISMIVAFVMCFAFVSCGNDGGTTGGGDHGGGNGPVTDPEIVTPAEAANAVGELFSAVGYSGKLSVAVDSDAVEKSEFTANISKLGDKLKISAFGEETILDISTGYMYNDGINGALFAHIIPQGTVGYIKGFVEANMRFDFDIAEFMPVYDVKTKSMTCDFDYSGLVNSYLEPFYDAVNYNKTVGELLNDYTELLTDGQFDFDNVRSLIDVAVGKVKDSTVSDAITAVKQMSQMPGFGDIANAVDKIPQEFIEKCGDRKVGEMIIGLYDYISALIPAEPADDSGESAGAPISVRDIIAGAIDAALNAEVDMATFDAKYNELTGIVTIALGYKVNALVEPILNNSPEFKTLVDNGVMFDKLGGRYVLRFDDDKSLAGFDLELGLRHDYDGVKTQDHIFLSDNNYALKFAFTVDWTEPDPNDFKLEFDADAGIWGTVNAVANVNGGNVDVFIETGGKVIDDCSLNMTIVLQGGTEMNVPDIGKTPYDKETSILRIETSNSGIKFAAGTIVRAQLTLNSGDMTYDVTVNVLFLDNDPETLMSILQTLIGNIGGEESPDTGIVN